MPDVGHRAGIVSSVFLNWAAMEVLSTLAQELSSALAAETFIVVFQYLAVVHLFQRRELHDIEPPRRSGPMITLRGRALC